MARWPMFRPPGRDRVPAVKFAAGRCVVRGRVCGLIAAVGAALASAAPAIASVGVSVPCAGTGGGPAGLIAAIVSADTGGGATITLASGCTYTFTAPYTNPSPAAAGNPGNLAYWYGPSALPAIAAPITIVGNGAVIERASAAGTPPFRLFFVGADPSAARTPQWVTPDAGSLTLRDLTLPGGLAKGGDTHGGSTGEESAGGAGLGAGGAGPRQHARRSSRPRFED